MRALLFSFLIVLTAPLESAAQGDAAIAAAGSPAGKPASAATTPAPSGAKAPEATAVTAAPGGSAALPPQGFSYNPEGRRDPFVNLLRRGSGLDLSSNPGSRPAGLKGLGAGEVTLKGTMASQGSYVGILQGADARTYVVRAGERLLDGTSRSITADALVILQQVNDPLSKETHREVRKVLRQTEEAR